MSTESLMPSFTSRRIATSGADEKAGSGKFIAAQNASTICALRREASLPTTASGTRGNAAAS